MGRIELNEELNAVYDKYLDICLKSDTAPIPKIEFPDLIKEAVDILVEVIDKEELDIELNPMIKLKSGQVMIMIFNLERFDEQYYSCAIGFEEIPIR